MKTRKQKGNSPQGIRISPDIHGLMVKAAALTEHDVGEVYTDAAVEWLRRTAAGNPMVRSLIDQGCIGNNELRLLIHRKTASSKPA